MIKTLLAAILLALAGCVPCAATDIYFGDSLSTGGVQNAYPWMLSYQKRLRPLQNFAVPGSQASDQGPTIMSYVPRNGNVHFYMIGTNDAPWYYLDAGQQQIFQNAVTAELYYLTGNVTWFGAPGCTESGAWQRYLGGGGGRYTTVPDATETCTFNGDVLVIATTTQDPAWGQFSITVDGASKGSFSTQAPGTIATHYLPPPGNQIAPSFLRITGNGPGNHTLVLTSAPTTTATNPVFVQWVWQGSNGLPTYMMTPPKMGPSAYSNTTYWPKGTGSDATMRIYGNLIKAAAAQVEADGGKVTVVDTWPYVDPGTDLNPADSLHLALGNYVVEMLLVQALSKP